MLRQADINISCNSRICSDICYLVSSNFSFVLIVDMTETVPLGPNKTIKPRNFLVSLFNTLCLCRLNLSCDVRYMIRDSCIDFC